MALAGLCPPSTALAQEGPLRPYLEALAELKAGRFEAAVLDLKRIIERIPDFDRAYGKLVEISHRLGQDEVARAYLEGQLHGPPENPHALYGLGLLLRLKGDAEGAGSRFEECAIRAPRFAPAYTELLQQMDPDAERLERVARFLDTALRDDPTNPAALFGMSLVHRRRHDEVKRAEYLRDALGAKPDLWEALMELAQLRARAGEIEEELKGLEDLLQALQAGGDVERAARVLRRIGDVYLETQDYPRAMDYFARSSALASETGDLRTELSAAARIGIVRKNQGRYREALQSYEGALDVSREIGDRPSEGRMLGLIADMHAELADYPDAIAAYSLAVVIAREARDRGSEAQQLASLGTVYATLGENDKALEHLETALRLAREEGDEGIEQEFLSNLGRVYERIGELNKALGAYAESARVAQGQGDRKAEAMRLGYSGNVQARLGNSAEAIRHYEQGLAIAREIGTVVIEAAISNDLAALQLKLGNVAKSLELHEKALSIGETTRNVPVVWRARAGLGAAFERRGATSEALEHYRRAIESIEALRGKIDLAEEKAGFFQDKLETYRKAVNLLLRLEGADPGQGHALSAFEYSEAAHARAFLDLMAEARLNVEGGIAPELLARQRELAQRLSEIQSQLIEAHSAKAPAQRLKALEGELARADDEYLGLRREVRRQHPRYAELQYPEPSRVSEVQRLLGEKTVLLEYLVGEGGSFVFAIRSKSYRFARLPPAPHLREEVTRLRNAVSRPERAALSTYVSLATRLHEELVLPVKDLLADVEEILVVPDDILHYLPFELLLSRTLGSTLAGDPARLPYLIRDYRVSYLPAASLLPTLARAEPAGSPPMTLLALGDPSYDLREASPDRAARLALRGAFERDQPWMLRRLEHSRDEVTRIARLYPPGQTDVLLGEQATEESLKTDGRLGQYRVIHLAAHGLLNESRPQFSGLVLSLPRPASAEGAPGSANPRASSEDGLLQAYEIFNMKLSADLVVLSACETGLGREIRGEGLVGLTRAFIYAGATAVVVSLWKVADASTAELMVRFHEHLLDGTRSRSEALRRAQLDLVEKSGFAHPFYWAPFVLVGRP
jgi:CHAT domain-containing protein/Tfp pilus assembly protein PilF